MHTTHHWTLGGDTLQPANALPLDDRGFRYGMHVFETVLVRGGRAHFAAEHMHKLLAACGTAGFPLDAAARAALNDKLASPPIDSGILRLCVTAGPGSPSEPPAPPCIVCTAESRPPLAPPVPPARLASSDIPAAPHPSGIKSGNYWRNAAALAAANEAGNTEALLFDTDGCLVSAATANVLVQLNDRWLTPHAATGRRHGVVLAWLAPRLDARPAVITRSDLLRATAVLITNSWWGPRPAASLDGRTLDWPPELSAIVRDYWLSLAGAP